MELQVAQLSAEKDGWHSERRAMEGLIDSERVKAAALTTQVEALQEETEGLAGREKEAAAGLQQARGEIATLKEELRLALEAASSDGMPAAAGLVTPSPAHRAPWSPAAKLELGDIQTPMGAEGAEDETAITIGPTPRGATPGNDHLGSSDVSVDQLQKSLSEELKKGAILEMQLKEEQERRLEAQAQLSDEQRRVEALEIEVSSIPNENPSSVENDSPSLSFREISDNLSSNGLDWKAKAGVVARTGGHVVATGWKSTAGARAHAKVFLMESRWGSAHGVWVYLLLSHVFAFVALRHCHPLA